MTHYGTARKLPILRPAGILHEITMETVIGHHRGGEETYA
jgi:hypothetical protein